MTELQIEQLGLKPNKSKLHPNRYWCDITKTYINIHKGLKHIHIIDIIFKIGYMQGVNASKIKK